MIDLQLETGLPFDPGLLEAAARAALDQEAGSPASLTILVAGDERLQELNREFLGRNAATDVLSFPSAEVDPETGRRYLGDIAISLPAATRQAERGGHSLAAECQLLTVHGVLHLLGYDHAAADEKDRMWSAQRKALAVLGLGDMVVEP